MAEAVIFDVDGTLIDSNQYHAEAWVDAFAGCGLRVCLPEMRAQIGKGADQLLPVFLSADQIRSMGKELKTIRGSVFKKRYLSRIKPFAHVRDLFERLLADGRKVALASSAEKDELAAYKNIAGIADLVPAETSSDDAQKSKPHPDIFQAALGKLGCRPEFAIVVGDTPYDCEAAGRAGIPFVGVTSGGWSTRELRQPGCVEVYPDIAALLDDYDNSPLKWDL